MMCRHCERFPVSRPRRLCWGCYYTPEVRARYPDALSVGIDERPYPDAETRREFYRRAGACLDALPDGVGVPVPSKRSRIPCLSSR